MMTKGYSAKGCASRNDLSSFAFSSLGSDRPFVYDRAWVDIGNAYVVVSIQATLPLLVMFGCVLTDCL